MMFRAIANSLIFGANANPDSDVLCERAFVWGGFHGGLDRAGNVRLGQDKRLPGNPDDTFIRSTTDRRR